MNRSLKTSGATSADLQRGRLVGEAGGLELGARPRVDERTAVARDPAGQALAAAHGHRADDVGLGAGGEAAAQRFDLLVEEEQRAGRERHEVRQLRRDQRHRVGDAEAGAHRLRDFVERVDFAVGERDVFEHRAALASFSGWKPTAGRPRSEVDSSDSRRGVAWSMVPAAAAISGIILTNICTTVGSSARPASCCSSASAASWRHRLVVRAVRGERVEVVDHRQDARAERNLLALQALRIALAVPALVVAEDQRRHRIRERHGADDLGADLRVHANLLELFLRQRAGLRQDVLGHRELADVVQQRRGLHALDLGVGHAEPARDARGVDLDAADVRLRGLILGVDGERERFDGGQVQIGHLLDVPPLVVDAAEVDLVGAVGEVERRERPAAPVHTPEFITAHVRDGRGAGADEVAGRAPQEVLVPDGEEATACVASATAIAIRQVLKTKYIVAAATSGRATPGTIVRERAGHAAERFVGEAGGLHGDGEARHAEQRPVERVLRLHPERALAPRARDRHEHRFVRPEQQQRREVDGVRHRHRRSALGERQADLERGRDGRGRCSRTAKSSGFVEASSAARGTPRGAAPDRDGWRRRRAGREAAGRACAQVSYEPQTALARIAMTADRPDASLRQAVDWAQEGVRLSRRTEHT